MGIGSRPNTAYGHGMPMPMGSMPIGMVPIPIHAQTIFTSPQWNVDSKILVQNQIDKSIK